MVLVATDPALRPAGVAEQLAGWSGAPLHLVLLTLHHVPEVPPARGGDPWRPGVGAPGAVSLAGWSYEPPPAPGPEPTGSARARRLRAEADARARGERLWEHVAADDGVAAVLDSADALAALDPGGLRTAFHLARRRPEVVATNGLLPALVELDHRAQTSEASLAADGVPPA